ncbi:MAG: TetR family transcriptional regulator [Myxococcota bacterium]|nr:TetR family transcriptional regulator [Myxococcota bacterium]
MRTDGEDEILDQSGRKLGPRALETRAKLLEATATMLSERSLRDVSVMEIARRVGTSPATFYQYFKEVEEAVLALHAEVEKGLPDLLAHFDADFDGPGGLDAARALVNAFLDHWDEHGPILRVRDLASDEGEPRFRIARASMLRPALEHLSKRVASSQEAGHVSQGLQPMATSAALLSILERLAAYQRDLEVVGVDRAALVESCARIVHQTITGQKAE